ncbi:MAG: hypothetical protein KW788_04305 [Candidatus Doudnabacteria bacterium]|nr:hypothetical protein [Candidatus Doudnabacteria bacterium]
MSELEKYIADSKAAGITEEQIKQSLLTQGWPEADIIAGLGSASAVAVVTPAAAVAVRSGGIAWFSPKIFALVLALVLAGGGGYFAYTKMYLADKDSGVKGILASKSNKDNIDCRKIFPESDFNRITGKVAADYELKQDLDNLGTGEDASSSNDISELGKNYVSGQTGMDVESYAQMGNARSINCYYVPKNPTEYEKQTLAISNVVLSPVTIIFVTNDVEGSIENNFAGIKADQLKRNGATIEFHGVTYPVAADYTKDVPGIGVSAYEQTNTLSFLSRNKKYIVGIIMDEKIVTSDKLREVGKIVDTNMQ